MLQESVHFKKAPLHPTQSAGLAGNRPVKLMLCLILCIAFTALSPSLAWATEISIPELKAKPGELADIPIMIDRVDNLAGLKLVMKYDHTILTFKGETKSKHTGSLMHIVNDKKPGTLIIVMAGAKGIAGADFSLINLKFAVKDGLKGNQQTTIQISGVEMMTDMLKQITPSIKVNPLVISTGAANQSVPSKTK